MIRREDYRPDIDGLRAVSVTAVILYHFFPGVLPGGYAGVDIFFVISGFLVTKTILTDLDHGNFSFRDFYARRIRRIVPAMLPVFIACLLFGGVFALSEDLSEQAQHILYSAGMIQNHALLVETAYFARHSDLNPLIHFWSLSIEEQFYILWAPLIFLCFRKGRNILWPVLLTLFLSSLVSNLLMIDQHPSRTFYLLPTRMWELCAGAFLCFLEERFRASDVQRKALSIFSLILIGCAFLFFHEKSPYPGYLALLPVIGAMTFILSRDGTANRALGLRPVVFIGLISYPLYLWHWPLYSFFSYLFPEQLSSADFSLLLLATFLLAYLTYVVIENPVRKIHELKAAKGLLISLFLICTLSGVIAYKEGFKSSHEEIEKKFLALQDYGGEDHLIPEFCREIDIKKCFLSDLKRAPTVALIGDSHANHWFPGFRKIYDQNGENLLLMAQSRTPPFFGVRTLLPEHTDMKEVFRIVTETPSIHTVILSAFWPIYANQHPVKVGTENLKIHISGPSSDRGQDHFFRTLLYGTLEKLRRAGKKVIFILDVPTVPYPVNKFMPKPFFEKEYFQCTHEENLCVFPMDQVKRDHGTYRSIVKRVLRNFPEVKVLDPLPHLCHAGSGLCHMNPDGKVVYWDEHHLGIEGSEYLARKLFNP